MYVLPTLQQKSNTYKHISREILQRITLVITEVPFYYWIQFIQYLKVKNIFAVGKKRRTQKSHFEANDFINEVKLVLLNYICIATILSFFLKLHS